MTASALETLSDDVDRAFFALHVAVDDQSGRALDKPAVTLDQPRCRDYVHQTVIVLQRVEDEALRRLGRLTYRDQPAYSDPDARLVNAIVCGMGSQNTGRMLEISSARTSRRDSSTRVEAQVILDRRAKTRSAEAP